MSNFPEVNKAYVNLLIETAKQKINGYESKIKTIDQALADAKDEFSSVSAILDYESKHDDRRRLLVDLFIYPGEYGTKEPESLEVIASFRKRYDVLKARISALERQRTKRIEGIELIKNDLDLLQKIQKHRNRHWMADAGIIDW